MTFENNVKQPVCQCKPPAAIRRRGQTWTCDTCGEMWVVRPIVVDARQQPAWVSQRNRWR